jgi:hypothetical protein
MTNERPLTDEEIFKIPERPGVFVLYAAGLPILVEAEEGNLRKRLLRCREQYPDATDFSIEGLQAYCGDRADLAENVRKRLGLARQAREPIGFSRPA